MAVRAVHLGVDGVDARSAGHVDDLARLVRRVEDVAVDPDRQDGRPHPGERRLGPAPAPAEVVQVHRLGQQQVAVGVEPPHELVALVLEVALDLEALPQRVALDRLDDLAAEAGAEHVVAAEGHHRDHAGGGQAVVGAVARPRRRSTRRPASAGPCGWQRRPLLHQPICWALAAAAVAIGTRAPTRSGYITPHSSTCIPPIDPPTTSAHRPMPRWSATAAWVRTMSRMVTTGKRDPHGSPVVGVRGGGTGGALTAAEHVGAHHEPAVGVDGEPGPDRARPTTRASRVRARGRRRRGCRP